MKMTQPITVNAPKRRFTIEEYYRLGEVGILQEDDRVELIYGELVQMRPIGPKHAGNLDRIVQLLTFLFKREAIIRAQSPIRLSNESEPEPDITVLKFRKDFFTSSHPGPQDILLVIELSESTLYYDKKVKLPLYADAGIPEYWVIDLNKEQLIRYYGPQLKEVQIMRKSATITSSILPKEITVKNLLGS